jgi:hypothetical protein
MTLILNSTKRYSGFLDRITKSVVGESSYSHKFNGVAPFQSFIYNYYAGGMSVLDVQDSRQVGKTVGLISLTIFQAIDMPGSKTRYITHNYAIAKDVKRTTEAVLKRIGVNFLVHADSIVLDNGSEIVVTGNTESRGTFSDLVIFDEVSTHRLTPDVRFNTKRLFVVNSRE